MHVTINQEQARRMRFHDSRNQEVITALFYLGYSVEYIVEMISNPSRDLERREAVQTARLLGMLDMDRVSVSVD